MEQRKQALSRIEISRAIEGLRMAQQYSEEAIALAKSDLEYGLSKEDIDLYLKKSYGIGQMKVLSDCLRKGVPEEFVALLCGHELTGYQMQVSLEFYEKGVPVECIRDVVMEGGAPAAMRSAYSRILERLNSAKEEAASEPEYVKGLIAQMEELVGQIRFQEGRYDMLHQKLSELCAPKAGKKEQEKLARENADKDEMISVQQDQLNQANGTIARLRDTIEKKDKEMGHMRDRIRALEKGREDAGAEGQKAPAGNLQQAEAPGQEAVPVSCQVPVRDAAGHVIQRVPLERAVRKGSGGAGLFARLCFKKKSRADIVRLVASGGLVPAQLVQIKSAIEKGLTEGQLVELINQNISAEKMKEIIEIAVLENSMAY